MGTLREFVLRLKPKECNMYFDGQQYIYYCCVFLIQSTIAAPVENILLYNAYTPARRYCVYCCTGCTRQRIGNRICCCTLGTTLLV